MKQSKMMIYIVISATIFLLLACKLQEKQDIYEASIYSIDQCEDIGSVLSVRIYNYVQINNIHDVSLLKHHGKYGVPQVGGKRVENLKKKFN